MDIQQVLSGKRVAKMNSAITYILVSVILGAVGQLLLKKGMSSMGPLGISFDGLGGLLWKIGTNPYVVSGLFIYVLGTLFWLVALSRVELSFAYPFASLSYLVMLAASWGLFHEDISLLRWIGTMVIVIGVLLISRS
jgi:drug/metabolite transporter (DMT)-like permease